MHSKRQNATQSADSQGLVHRPSSDGNSIRIHSTLVKLVDLMSERNTNTCFPKSRASLSPFLGRRILWFFGFFWALFLKVL